MKSPMGIAILQVIAPSAPPKIAGSAPIGGAETIVNAPVVPAFAGRGYQVSGSAGSAWSKRLPIVILNRTKAARPTAALATWISQKVGVGSVE